MVFLLFINNVTRQTNHFKTCIDHIFTNNINSHILRSGLTDHFTTILMLLSDLYKHDKNIKKKKNKTR
jgi:hypothetical protein